VIPGDLNILKDGTDVVSHALGDVAGDDGVVERSAAVSGLDSYPCDAHGATLTPGIAHSPKKAQDAVSVHFGGTASLFRSRMNAAVLSRSSRARHSTTLPAISLNEWNVEAL
jgi:hypothetical protein